MQGQKILLILNYAAQTTPVPSIQVTLQKTEQFHRCFIYNMQLETQGCFKFPAWIGCLSSVSNAD